MSDSSKTETPAETIRRAAVLMRELAGGCEPRRWHWRALGEKRYPQRVSSDGNVALIAETFISPEHRPYEAEHIASWSPPIAEAVADLLEEVARQYDAPPCDSPAGACNGCEWREDFTDALRLAQAYLGAEANMTGGAA
jgi:hypothetical protein